MGGVTVGRRRLQIPMVHMSHTLGAAKNVAAQQPWEQEPPRRLRIEQEILRYSNAVIAESPASKDQMRQAYAVDPGKIEIIPGGVDVAVFRPQDRRQMRQWLALEPEQPVLLFVGRLQPLKGIDTLLRAAHIVRQQYAALQVIIVGGGVDAQDDHEAKNVDAYKRSVGSLGSPIRCVLSKHNPRMFWYSIIQQRMSL